MAEKLNVDKLSVKEFLASGQDKKFKVPEYQRPYDWEEENAEKLFDDVWRFAREHGGEKHRQDTYFLGSVVLFENKNVQEIIDGQQRITSLMLLLRAVYSEIENTDTDEAKNFRGKIETTICRVDRMSAKPKWDSILLESAVIGEQDRETLKNILAKGKCCENKSNYARNYALFVEKIKKEIAQCAGLQKDKPFNTFIFALLYQVKLLPITASDFDMAMEIFTTLNDRGRPLTDADVFKADIYRSRKSKKEQEKFVSDWKALLEKAERVGEDTLPFSQYMVYLRASDGNEDSALPGLRKFFREKRRLEDKKLMDDLDAILSATRF